jgi:NhaA family Na+:H+ antiporter
MSGPTSPNTILARGSWTETSRIAAVLRKETVGGALLVAATALAMVWANSPLADAYTALRDYKVGPEALHLHLSLGTWAADGLLAIFFFVVGLELKREFVAGDLRDPRRAALPILAAVGGMVAPAVIFIAVNVNAGDGALRGWAIPTATDIAFALAVLAVISTHLPTALRTFLLTLAVVDDLFAVTIIAVFYTSDLHLAPLLGALLPLAAFTVAVQKRIRSWWLLLPLAAATWTLVHDSGVHATVAGVLLGFGSCDRAERDRRPRPGGSGGNGRSAADAGSAERTRLLADPPRTVHERDQIWCAVERQRPRRAVVDRQ